MELAHDPVFIWLSQFAFQPGTVYSALVGMMLLSSVGLPFPEEMTLISVGILAYMGANPQHFPPPYPGAPVVNVHTAAIVAFGAVFVSDCSIYTIGRVFGRKLLSHPRVRKILSEKVMRKVEEWTHKYGVYACGIFRFTPGIRFPGHLAYGIMRFPFWKFVAIDGIAAAISVPTQIYLLATYGEPILLKIRHFKYAFFGAVLVLILYIAIHKYREHQSDKAEEAAEAAKTAASELS